MEWFVGISDSLPCQNTKFTPVKIIKHIRLGASFFHIRFTHNLIHTRSLKVFERCMQMKK